MKFGQYPSQGSQDKAAKVLCSASTVPLIALSITAKISVCSACVKIAMHKVSEKSLMEA
jgi:hypothetical protein